MAYNPYNGAKPDPTADNGTAFGTNIRINDAALRDGIILGGMPGWTYAQSGGSAAEPTQILHSSGTERLKQDLTWASGNLTQVISSYSSNSGTAYDVLGTATASYSTNDLTAVSSVGSPGGISGFVLKIMSALGKITALTSSFNAHTSANGTAVHGLGAMALQAPGAVTITGGTLDNVTIGGTTRNVGNFLVEREAYTDIGTIATAGTATINASGAGWYDLTLSTTAASTATITLSGVPPAGLAGGVIINVITGATFPNTVTWSNMTWPGGTTPTLVANKKNIITVFAKNNVGTYYGNLTGSYA